MHLDYLSIVIRWISLIAIFLFLTYSFRDRVTLEGFWGYVILILILVPINLFEPFRDDVFAAIHPSNSISQSADQKNSSDVASPDQTSDDDESSDFFNQVERQRSITYMAVLLPFNILMLFLWSKYLPRPDDRRMVGAYRFRIDFVCRRPGAQFYSAHHGEFGRGVR